MAYEINPEQLEQSENLGQFGERKSYHKSLSTKDIISIRDKYLSGVTQRELVQEYGVSYKSIYMIVHLLSYKDVPNGSKNWDTSVYLEMVKERGK